MATARAHFEALADRCRAVGWEVQITNNGHAKVRTTGGKSFTFGVPGGNKTYKHNLVLAKRHGLLEAEQALSQAADNGNSERQQATGGMPLMVAPGQVDQIPDGRAVLARQPAQAPHPHPSQNGRLVVYTGVDEVLLEDGETVYQCSRATDCQYIGRTVKQVSSHSATHSREPGKSVYPEETLRLLIRLVKIEERAGRLQGKVTRTAKELNRRGIPTAHGQPWTAEGVSALYNTYKDTLRVHVPNSRVAQGREQAAKPTTAKRDGSTAQPEPAALAPEATQASEPSPKPGSATARVVNETPVNTELGPMMVYSFPLRPDLIVRLTLPADLTVPEAERFAGFVRSLAF